MWRHLGNRNHLSQGSVPQLETCGQAAVILSKEQFAEPSSCSLLGPPNRIQVLPLQGLRNKGDHARETSVGMAFMFTHRMRDTSEQNFSKVSFRYLKV